MAGAVALALPIRLINSRRASASVPFAGIAGLESCSELRSMVSPRGIHTGAIDDKRISGNAPVSRTTLAVAVTGDGPLGVRVARRLRDSPILAVTSAATIDALPL